MSGTSTMEENTQLAEKTEDQDKSDSSTPNNPKEMTKKRIIKNLIILAFGQFLIFTAFDSLGNLQSTMNSESGVGIASQAVIYAFFTISSFFLPAFIIQKLGCKTTLVASVFSICPYVASNMYPRWETLIPAALICGMAFGPFWAARSTYINEISYAYAAHIHGSIDIANAWFFGISSFFHENAEIWGNVISYLVLKPVNGTDDQVWDETLSTCGASFCDFHTYNPNPNLHPPPKEKRLRLTVIYLVLTAVAGTVIKLFLDPLISENSNSGEERENPESETNLFIATFKHLKHRNQLLLLPLSLYCGLADGFYNSDFTKSFIACSSGISQVGFVTIAYGVTCAVMDCSSGILVKYITRVPVFLLAACAHITMLIVCLHWTPTQNNSYVLFLLSGIYGVGSSVWWAQIAALYGVVFKNTEEAAFSNFYFWSSLGLLLAYSYSNYICTYIKIYILISLLVISMFGYLAVEKRALNEKTVAVRELEPLSDVSQVV